MGFFIPNTNSLLPHVLRSKNLKISSRIVPPYTLFQFSPFSFYRICVNGSIKLINKSLGKFIPI